MLIFFKCLLNAVFCIQLRVSSLIYVPVYIKHTYVNRIWWNKSSQVENFTLQHQSEPDQVIDTTVTKLNKLISRRIVDCAFLTREQHHSPNYFTGIACHSTSSIENSPSQSTLQISWIQFFQSNFSMVLCIFVTELGEFCFKQLFFRVKLAITWLSGFFRLACLRLYIAFMSQECASNSIQVYKMTFLVPRNGLYWYFFQNFHIQLLTQTLLREPPHLEHALYTSQFPSCCLSLSFWKNTHKKGFFPHEQMY